MYVDCNPEGNQINVNHIGEDDRSPVMYTLAPVSAMEECGGVAKVVEDARMPGSSHGL